MKKFLATVILGLFLCFSLSAKTITLTDQNTISLNGRVDAQSTTRMMVQLQELNKIQTDDPIYLVVNSPGGSIYDGFDFIRFAKTSKRKINTVTVFAASMAFQLVEALGDRYVTPYSTLMSHKARGGFDGEFPGQLDSRYAHVLSHLAEQDKIVINRTKGKQTLESYAKLIQNEYWANSTKAVDDGFADEEVNVSCDKSLEGDTVQTVDLGFFSVDVVLSKCPLITQPLSIVTNRGDIFIRDNKIDIVQEYKKIFSAKNVQF
jgi:ATP-dependent Clp protease protease subunit